MDYSELGARIRAKREHDGLTHQDVARIAGVHRATICRLENGAGHTPGIETLAKILRWLGTLPEGAICYFPAKSLPDIVDDLLLLDLSIPDEAAISLMGIFRNAYEGITQG